MLIVQYHCRAIVVICVISRLIKAKPIPNVLIANLVKYVMEIAASAVHLTIWAIAHH